LHSIHRRHPQIADDYVDELVLDLGDGPGGTFHEYHLPLPSPAVQSQAQPVEDSCVVIYE
jgi:hypothetical protein